MKKNTLNKGLKLFLIAFISLVAPMTVSADQVTTPAGLQQEINNLNAEAAGIPGKIADINNDILNGDLNRAERNAKRAERRRLQKRLKQIPRLIKKIRYCIKAINYANKVMAPNRQGYPTNGPGKNANGLKAEFRQFIRNLKAEIQDQQDVIDAAEDAGLDNIKKRAERRKKLLEEALAKARKDLRKIARGVIVVPPPAPAPNPGNGGNGGNNIQPPNNGDENNDDNNNDEPINDTPPIMHEVILDYDNPYFMEIEGGTRHTAYVYNPYELAVEYEVIVVEADSDDRPATNYVVESGATDTVEFEVAENEVGYLFYIEVVGFVE